MRRIKNFLSKCAGMCKPMARCSSRLVGGAFALIVVTACSGESKAERAEQAMAMWRDRCKNSGEFIHRTVDGVDGIYLLKLRPDQLNYDNQFKLDDPYGRDLRGQGYIESFLRGSFQHSHKDIPPDGPPRLGYRYVEAVSPEDGKRYRYTGAIKATGKKDVTAPGIRWELDRNPAYDLNIYRFVVDKVLASGEPPRYAVTYDDISTPEERKFWIAGSSLKIIDRKSGEVIAERIGYMVDRGQGNSSGGRSPWLFAADNACPDFTRNFKIVRSPPSGHRASSQPYQTLDFVERVIRPKK